MNDKLIYVLVSKEYQFLRWMEQNQTNTASGPVVKFSQVELAEEYGSSPATVNKWLAELRRVNCVESYKKRGNYRVTATGHKVIAKMEEIEKLIGGKRNG